MKRFNSNKTRFPRFDKILVNWLIALPREYPGANLTYLAFPPPPPPPHDNFSWVPKCSLGSPDAKHFCPPKDIGLCYVKMEEITI